MEWGQQFTPMSVRLEKSKRKRREVSLEIITKDNFNNYSNYKIFKRREK